MRDRLLRARRRRRLVHVAPLREARSNRWPEMVSMGYGSSVWDQLLLGARRRLVHVSTLREARSHWSPEIQKFPRGTAIVGREFKRTLWWPLKICLSDEETKMIEKVSSSSAFYCFGAENDRRCLTRVSMLNREESACQTFEENDKLESHGGLVKDAKAQSHVPISLCSSFSCVTSNGQ